MPSAPCWNTAVRHQARNKPEDLPRGARKPAVSDIPIRFERSPRTGQEELAGFFLAAVGIVSSESRGTTLSGPDAAHRRSGGHGGCRVHSLDGAIRGRALSRWRRGMAKAACSHSWPSAHGVFAISFFSRCPWKRSSANESCPVCAGRPNFTWHGFRKVLLHFREACQWPHPIVESGIRYVKVLQRLLETVVRDLKRVESISPHFVPRPAVRGTGVPLNCLCSSECRQF